MLQKLSKSMLFSNLICSTACFETMALFRSLRVISILPFTLLIPGCVAGNCDDIQYTTVNDPRRSTAYIITSNITNTTANVLCDRNVVRDDSWYRFSSEVGEEMPTSPPDFHACGTYAPIWMNGTHPTVEEGRVIRQACVKLAYTKPLHCRESYEIGVLNCSGYYIYQLKEPTTCHYAYCAGSKRPNCSVADLGTVCPANAPPYFTMPSQFYAMQNSQLEVKIKAVDPEAHPLTYRLLSNISMRNASLSHDRLTVDVANESGRVCLQVEDFVRARRSHVLQITVVPCPCYNGGSCVWDRLQAYPVHRPNYTCNCVQPYTGHLCARNSNAKLCEELPCFRGVKCLATQEGYTCDKCPEMFEGDGRTCRVKKESGTVTVKGELTVVTGLDWKDDLLRKDSLFFKNVTAKLTALIKESYANVTEFVYVIIMGYRRGSVVVEFQLILTKEVDRPLEPLKTPNLGPLMTDPNKLKHKKPEVKSSDKKYFGLHKTVFIVVAVTVSLLAITAIVLVGICIKKKKICIKKKKICIVTLTMSDDRAEIYPNQAPFHTPARSPSRNRVGDIAMIENQSCVDLPPAKKW